MTTAKYDHKVIKGCSPRTDLNSRRNLSASRPRGVIIRGKQIGYDHRVVEKHWQDVWEKTGIYKAVDFDKKRKKFYQLVEFPYPSGAGLHIGHIRSWASMDAYSRKKRMDGFNVLYPMGWDAFGLPAENYAIKTGIHPSVTVRENIITFKKQCKALGLSFDWSREIDTTDSFYYKWTQWIFVQLFKSGLAYQSEVPVNWCSFCKTNLADEEVMPDGKHERCGNPTEKRMQKQWLLRITKYADRLLSDLNKVDFSPRIRIQQENWIGKSVGAEIKFDFANPKDLKTLRNLKSISVFTTRPDTLYGATFLVVSPKYAKEYILKYISSDNLNSVTKYINEHQELSLRADAKQSQLGGHPEPSTCHPEERSDEGSHNEKTGIDSGIKAINPATNKEIPIYISDYVLDEYGTGAIMGVPAHDERDFAFAKKFNLPIIQVIKENNAEISGNNLTIEQFNNENDSDLKDAYTSEGVLVNSNNWDGLSYPKDISTILSDIKKRGWGKKSSSYHIHDWIFSRQHYWGEPIPMVYCEKCAKEGKSWVDANAVSQQSTGYRKSKKTVDSSPSAICWNSTGWFPVSESDLPVTLPFMEKYQPSGTGESPLATNAEFIKTKCPHCGGDARRETDTMPNWAGSNWYFVRYLDPNNDKQLADSKKLKYWMPVDFYQGGYEHTTLHLLYSRFIYKFLYDIGVVPTSEPYAKRRSHGIVLGADGRKMSKSFGNVINPDSIVEKYGADTLRIYEMFMGPFDQMVVWSQESLEGCYRFINRLWKALNEKVGDGSKDDISSKRLSIKLHQTIKKVSEDIEDLKFNTAVSAMMEFLNAWDQNFLSKDDAKKFCLLLAPFTPHLAEEVWQKLNGQMAKLSNGYGNKQQFNNLTIKQFKSVHTQTWPTYDPKLIIEEKITIPIQINGKLRGTIEVDRDKIDDEKFVLLESKRNKVVQKWMAEGKVIKEIYVHGRLVNFVVNYF